MLDHGVEASEREFGTDPLSVSELDKLIGTRDYKAFLNTRNELYRERDMKNKPPTRADALKLMAQQPNLIRRPILIVDGEMALGFDERTRVLARSVELAISDVRIVPSADLNSATVSATQTITYEWRRRGLPPQTKTSISWQVVKTPSGWKIQ